MRPVVVAALVILLAGCSAPGRSGAEPTPTQAGATLDFEGVAFDLVAPDGTTRHGGPVLLHRLETYPTGFEGGEPTVRSTQSVSAGNGGSLCPGQGGVLVTGSEEVVRSLDGPTWQKVYDAGGTADPVMAWDPVLCHAVKVDLSTALACADIAVSDATGLNWTKEPQACSATMDYLKVAAGPVGPEPNPLAMGPSATYLCHNAVPPTNPCLVSFDGARSFHASGQVPVSPCGGVTSYPVVNDTGVVFLPVHGLSCGPDFLISRDSGLTWTLLAGPAGDIQGSSYNGSMTSVAFDGLGHRLVASWEAPGGAAIAYTSDLKTWHGPFLVRVPGLDEVAFNAMQTDGVTVTVAFLGEMDGTWNLYVAHVVPEGDPVGAVDRVKDPAQVGPICRGGASCTGNRNMLDFITATTFDDHVVIGWTDGCVQCDPSKPSSDQMLTITKVVP